MTNNIQLKSADQLSPIETLRAPSWPSMGRLSWGCAKHLRLTTGNLHWEWLEWNAGILLDGSCARDWPKLDICVVAPEDGLDWFIVSHCLLSQQLSGQVSGQVLFQKTSDLTRCWFCLQMHDLLYSRTALQKEGCGGFRRMKFTFWRSQAGNLTTQSG